MSYAPISSEEKAFFLLRNRPMWLLTWENIDGT